MLLVPFVGMAWAGDDGSTENRELAPAPSLTTEEGGWNVDLLSEWGDYFSDHFAYRSAMVDMDARLYAGVFGVSTTDQVVVGSDGWLYYAGTLNDYQGRAPLRVREARNIAYNLRMLQDYCEAQGARFAFAIAPDKNALYGDAMPGYYPAADDGNRELLREQLEDQGVNAVDLFDAFQEQDDLLYFLRDSHWSDKGALLAQDELVAAVGDEALPLDEDDLVAADDYVGDLNRMIFPLSGVPERNWYAEGVNDGSGESGSFRSGSLWRYAEGQSTEDDTVRTESTTKAAQENGRLLMFRDSFANNLIPYLASEYSQATFTKLVPYNGLLAAELRPQAVMVERTQRHVRYLGEQASIMPCPLVRLGAAPEADTAATASCEMGENGPLLSFRGWLDGTDGLALDAEVFVRVTGDSGEQRIYRAFALTDAESGNDWGYHVYANKEAWRGQEVSVDVLVGSLEQSACAGSFRFAVER